MEGLRTATGLSVEQGWLDRWRVKRHREFSWKERAGARFFRVLIPGGLDPITVWVQNMAAFLGLVGLAEVINLAV